MDPLTPYQLELLRQAATQEGCAKWLPKSARRVLRLGLVEERGGRLWATDKGREWLRKVDGDG